MKYFHLIWAALFRRKTRTFLTLVSIIAAFLLFGLLDTVRVAFNPGDSVVGAGRLVVTSKMSFMASLPMSLDARIQQVPGVKDAAYASWFGGFYQDPKNQMPSFAVSPNYIDLYPEIVLPPEQRKAWEQNRIGIVVGDTLAKKFGWKIGDKIPLQSTVWPSRSSGNNTWQFEISGIMHGKTDKDAGFGMMALMHWKYFDENNQYRSGEVHWFVAQVADPAQADAVSNRIDALSANSSHETKTQTEQSFQANFLKQLVNIGLIVLSIMGAVFFTLLLLTGNTMMQAVRERTSELAVLKTIGFSSTSVLLMVLAESMLLLLLGGVIGLGLVAVIVPGLGAASGGMMPVHAVGSSTWFIGIGLMLLIGFIVGALPAWRAMRLNMVDALRAG
ncbi:MAG TPA: ABC transporter permease [Rhodanobacteraceae bacterium]|nr:ABC transporter permease [Rhodanobacteraceae bacterium]